MKKLMAIASALIIVTFCVSCSLGESHTSSTLQGAATESAEVMPIQLNTDSIELQGRWIIDLDSDVMLDPQTSGLKYAGGYLYSVSDASADESQIRKLHQISMSDSRITAKFGPTRFSLDVAESCFYNYLSDKPDYEGLVPVRDKEGVWILVTEDASRSAPLSDDCQQRYQATGSTIFPSLLVRFKLTQDHLEVTHVRPVQFSLNSQVGDFPNDGIEGLTITKDNRLLLGLEKDAQGQPRVFEVPLTEDFWQTKDFVKATDSELLLPAFGSGNHPINGMDVYYPSVDSKGYLLAAARNDSELWIIDLAKIKPTKRIDLSFRAPSEQSQLNRPEVRAAVESQISDCDGSHLMNNASIEGLAVVENEVWLVNDPWKFNYMKNVVCILDEKRYKRMAPLLFKMEISADWFE